MKIYEILEENRKYSKWKEEIDLDIKRKQSEIYGLNKNINFDEIKELGYEKAKELFNEIKYNLNYKEDRPRFEKLLEELKEMAYPEIKKAHYYPILNEIDFLDEEKIRILDSTLYRYNKRWNISNRNWNLFGDITYDQEIVDKIIEFMLEKDMLSKKYILTCPCGEESEEISEEKYLNMKKYFDIESRFKTDNVSKEEEDWYEDFDVYKKGVSEIGCECEGLEICSMEDIDDNLSFEYRIKIEANLELARK